MEPKKYDINIEQLFRDDLHQYLLSIGMVDERLPEAQDIEELWQKIGESYLPDGMREFRDYPTVSLGWMMFVGMAIAKYWDTDWELYSKVDDLYKYLRDQRDFDHMDEYVCEKVLLLDEEQQATMAKTVGECASRTYNLLPTGFLILGFSCLCSSKLCAISVFLPSNTPSEARIFASSLPVT